MLLDLLRTLAMLYSDLYYSLAVASRIAASLPLLLLLLLCVTYVYR